MGLGVLSSELRTSLSKHCKVCSGHGKQVVPSKNQGEISPSDVAADPLPYAVRGSSIQLTGLILPLTHISQVHGAHPAVTEQLQAPGVRLPHYGG